MTEGVYDVVILLIGVGFGMLLLWTAQDARRKAKAAGGWTK